MATRAFSASCRAWRANSRRFSWVNGGNGTRTTSPTVAGVRPRSLARMAFAIAGARRFSHGVTSRLRASSTVMLASCFTGVDVP